MLQIPLNQVKDDLSRYLRLAIAESVIITRHGVPAGMLVGFEDPEDWWEELLLRDPRLKTRVAEARKSLREGKGITLEQFRAQHDLSEAKVAKTKTQRKTKKRSAKSQPPKKRAAKAAPPT